MIQPFETVSESGMTDKEMWKMINPLSSPIQILTRLEMRDHRRAFGQNGLEKKSFLPASPLAAIM
jgi:hypothetical protein